MTHSRMWKKKNIKNVLLSTEVMLGFHSFPFEMLNLPISNSNLTSQKFDISKRYIGTQNSWNGI